MSRYAPTPGVMKRLALLAMLPLAGCMPAPAATPAETSTAWAYPTSPPASGAPAPVDKVTRVHLPGSDVTFTAPELTNIFAAPDWHPSEHPPMPPVVANGRKPDVRACAYCHLPSGDGRPENAALAGLPHDYIVEQMLAFRSGARHSSVVDRVPTIVMEASAKAATDAEIEAAASYFSSLTHRSFTRVVEATQVPRSVTRGWLYSRDPAGGTEPIGARIIEMPDDMGRFEQRDPAMRYIAYVPPGSIARGARLARTWGDGGQYACASCHGADFKGVGNVPPLAARSPTFIVRQLNDFRTGARGGEGAELMKPVASAMRNEDMIAIAAFLGSRKP